MGASDLVEVSAVEAPSERSALCERVLRALPDWFGVEESLQNYVREVADLPVFVASLDSREAGFVAFKRQTDSAGEVCVMGVYRWAHRRGVGRALIERLEELCRQEGRTFLTVKTLAASHPDQGYADTRGFYAAMGFCPLEVFPTLWDEANPCLLMAKWLGTKEIA